MKPIIKKRDGGWVYAGYYDDRVSNFVSRLNRKDTGYKDCHGCTIREGDRLFNTVTKNMWDANELCFFQVISSYLKIIRP